MACSHYDTPVPKGLLSLATNGSEIAVAWHEVVEGRPVHFTRFAADLMLLSDTPCIGDGTWGVSLTATATGWLVAAASSAGTLDLTRLDSQGAVQSTLQLGTPGADSSAIPYWGPQVVAGPSGGFLLSWMSTAGTFNDPLQLQALDTTGSPSGTAQTVDHVMDWASVAVDDGFAIAANVDPTSTGSAIQTLHLGLDGKLTTGASIPTDNRGGSGRMGVSLAWGGSSLWLTYTTTGYVDAGGLNQSLLQQATRDGVPVGSPVLIDASYDLFYSAYPIVAVGTDTAILMPLGGPGPA